MDSTCTLCEHPYPYNCEHCVMQCEAAMREELAQEIPEIKKVFIGSGEDVDLEILYS